MFNLQARWQNALAQAKHQVFQVGLNHSINDNSQQYSLGRFFTALKVSRKKCRRNTRLVCTGVASACALSGIAFYYSALNAYAFNFVFGVLGAFLVGVIKPSKTISDDVLYHSSAYNIARIILLCLHQKGHMKTELCEERLEEILYIKLINEDTLRFSLNGYTRQENELFLEVLNEFLQPLSSSRYLLALNKNPSIQDLFTIPKLLGNNKKDAASFLLEWNKVFPEFKEANVIQSSSLPAEKLLLRASAKEF